MFNLQGAFQPIIGDIGKYIKKSLQTKSGKVVAIIAAVLTAMIVFNLLGWDKKIFGKSFLEGFDKLAGNLRRQWNKWNIFSEKPKLVQKGNKKQAKVVAKNKTKPKTKKDSDGPLSINTGELIHNSQNYDYDLFE